MKQAINCDDSPGGVLIDGELGFLASRLPQESWPGINPMSRNDSVVCTASINPRHDRKRGEIAREKEREGTRGRGSLFTLAVAGGIDDYQEDSWSCPRRARSTLVVCGAGANDARGWTRDNARVEGCEALARENPVDVEGGGAIKSPENPD